MNNVRYIIDELSKYADEKDVKGMMMYEIRSSAKILGVPKPKLREIAKKIGANHELALKLWKNRYS